MILWVTYVVVDNILIALAHTSMIVCIIIFEVCYILEWLLPYSISWILLLSLLFQSFDKMMMCLLIYIVVLLSNFGILHLLFVVNNASLLHLSWQIWAGIREIKLMKLCGGGRNSYQVFLELLAFTLMNRLRNGEILTRILIRQWHIEVSVKTAAKYHVVPILVNRRELVIINGVV